ncbi:hypothetical protein CHLRE_11g477200v5 [Chlamydomonas reinhardtii]|uniref:NmrA-like domain-containing protein n=1 Tax=Chlamydomonas reinhardtii TaxID=3055 RepID=A0A2K3D8E8_CHLRE|nr:uncharacterized protein CHLRE_11g477200v5 [Chlamydomonas reinhardtii]XP_042919654.1 uncharacterized protein CHLRE_11g477200v5 [Chlamydomonas reinhardtii]PNW76810.1 hypothetical protein CHLRE_11g477200v5 [Chlamydomonas reinhardtii]PNW76811.1 hypothetical protein CHLRE_11g477200v5 [Chlamydomonas reinhardtii]
MATKKHTVAVIGGSGLLGKHIVNGLLENGHYDVTVVSRKGGDDSKLAPFVAKGAKIAHVDYNEQASLVVALKGQEIVISTVGAAALSEQPKYIEAAKAAGVRRFVPSEFGFDSGAPGVREYFPAMGYKYATQDALRASGLEYTFVITGFFLETQFTNLFYWDVPGGKATVKGDTTQPFTLTSLVDVGRWTAEALLDPASKNATVYLVGEVLTYEDAIKTVEKATGKTLAVTRASKADLDRDIAAAPDVWASFLDLLLRAISDGRGRTVPLDKAWKSKAHPQPSRTLATWAPTASWQFADA